MKEARKEVDMEREKDPKEGDEEARKEVDMEREKDPEEGGRTRR